MNELVAFTLVLFLIYPNGKTETEMRPIEVPNFHACFFEGEKRAAIHWGHVPGLRFKIVCMNESESRTIGAQASGGHPSLSFKKE